LIRFVSALLLTAATLGGLTWLAFDKGIVDHLPSFFYETLIFLVFATVVIYGYLYRTSKPGMFVQLYLLTMAVKLLAYGAYNLVMILQDQPGAVANVVFFMAIYAAVTILEIGFLYRKISRENPS
jgi:hypothetical protein